MEDNESKHSMPVDSSMLDPVIAAEARVKHSVFSDRVKALIFILLILVLLLTLVGLGVFLIWAVTDIDSEQPIGTTTQSTHILVTGNATHEALVVTTPLPTPVIIPNTTEKEVTEESTTAPTAIPTTITTSPNTESSTTTEIVEDNFITTSNEGSGGDPLERIMSPEVRENCYQHLTDGGASGLYLINPGSKNDTQPFLVYCDMDTPPGGWTVIQRRVDGSEQFERRSFRQYEEGFGDLSGTHWLGLSKMHRIAPTEEREKQQILRVELRGDLCNSAGCSRTKDDGYWYGEYEFSLGSALEHYPISLSENELEGNLTVKDSKTKWNVEANKMKFTVAEEGHDFDESRVNCAQFRFFGPWWHRDCTVMALNGRYGDSAQSLRHLVFSREDKYGTGYIIKPQKTLMMIRPQN